MRRGGKVDGHRDQARQDHDCGKEHQGEGADQRRVQIGELELGGRFSRSLLGEDEKQLEGVAICGDSVRAGLALADQPLGDICLKGRCKGGHARPSRCASSRCPASAISSGAADRYQKVCLGSVCPR